MVQCHVLQLDYYNNMHLRAQGHSYSLIVNKMRTTHGQLQIESETYSCIISHHKNLPRSQQQQIHANMLWMR